MFKSDSTTGFSMLYLDETAVKQQLGALWAKLEPCIFDADSLLPVEADAPLLNENNFYLLVFRNGVLILQIYRAFFSSRHLVSMLACSPVFQFCNIVYLFILYLNHYM